MTDQPTPATLRATALIDSDAPAVRAFAGAHARGDSERERAVALYLAVRDGFRYDPYRVDLSPEGMAAGRALCNAHTATWLGGRGVKATPAFNIELCERFGLLPLAFDGRSDSIYHPFDKA